MEVNEYCAIEGTDLPQMVFSAERKVLSDLFFEVLRNDNLTEEEADKINAFIENGMRHLVDLETKLQLGKVVRRFITEQKRNI